MSQREWMVRWRVRRAVSGRWYWVVVAWGDPVQCGYERTAPAARLKARELAKAMRRKAAAYGSH